MKKLICLIFTAALFVSSGCKKSFFDVNTNPNSPTDAAVTTAALLPRLLHRTAEKMATSYGNYGGWMGYWARSGSYGPSTEEESYNISTGFEADEWGWYDILADANTMEAKGTATGQTFYVGIAKIIKSIGYMYLVDQYNNVPYSQAFNIKNKLTPGYDKGSDIYKDLLVQLNAATALIAEAKADANPGIASADIMFHGDGAMWRKLANTQHLKLLIHESEVINGADVSAEIAKITADGSGFLSVVGKNGSGTDESAYVNPPYADRAQNKQNPFWNTYQALYTGDLANAFWRANNYLLNDVYGWSSSSSYDTRFLYVFDKAVTPLKGNTYYGYNYGEVIPNTDPKSGNSSDVSGPGLAYSGSQPQWMFTTVESLFLQAEAIQRGWLPGTAKSAYDAAVKASFVWLGGSIAEATDYLDNDPHADFDGAASKIEIIAFQKYIALAGINNFEAYVDYRRLDGADAILTDLPLSLAPSRGANKIPLRILYPQNEYNYNAANVAAEGTINPQTSRIFWDKGPR